MRRNIIIIILLFAILTATVGCVMSGQTTHPGSQTTTGQSGSQQTTPQPLPNHPSFVAQYVRTDGYHKDKQYPIITVIRNRAELSAYYENNKDLYDLERRSKPASDSTFGFLNAIDKYNDDYFNNNVLILILVQESSGSNRHQVNDIIKNDTELDIQINRLVPEIGTADMAQWHILVKLKASDLGQATIRISFDKKSVQRNRIELVSHGITYPLIEHWVFSVANGVSADGKWFDKLALKMDPELNADLAAASEIPYSTDFSFFRVGSGGSEELGTGSYNIYDENMEPIYTNVTKLEVPTEPGLYYVAVLASWGEENNRSSYQYIFKTRRP